jgi:hypothetical protein
MYERFLSTKLSSCNFFKLLSWESRPESGSGSFVGSGNRNPRLFINPDLYNLLILSFVYKSVFKGLFKGKTLPCMIFFLGSYDTLSSTVKT